MPPSLLVANRQARCQWVWKPSCLEPRFVDEMDGMDGMDAMDGWMPLAGSAAVKNRKKRLDGEKGTSVAV